MKLALAYQTHTSLSFSISSPVLMCAVVAGSDMNPIIGWNRETDRKTWRRIAMPLCLEAVIAFTFPSLTYVSHVMPK